MSKRRKGGNRKLRGKTFSKCLINQQLHIENDKYYTTKS